MKKILEGYGYRVQKSVFECEVSSQLNEKMRTRITRVIEPAEDSVRYYILCQNCLPNIHISGLGEVQRDKPLFVV